MYTLCYYHSIQDREVGTHLHEENPACLQWVPHSDPGSLNVGGGDLRPMFSTKTPT